MAVINHHFQNGAGMRVGCDVKLKIYSMTVPQRCLKATPTPTHHKENCKKGILRHFGTLWDQVPWDQSFSPRLFFKSFCTQILFLWLITDLKVIGINSQNHLHEIKRFSGHIFMSIGTKMFDMFVIKDCKILPSTTFYKRTTQGISELTILILIQ